MFRGRFERTIDSKGRVSIPAEFREILAEEYDDRLILTNFDRCIVAFPYKEWEIFEEKVSNSLSMFKRETKSFQRFFISGASECPIDRLGRILIPPTLRNWAQLERDVVFAGMQKRFEIWRKERFQEEIQRSAIEFEAMGDLLASLGF
ncbi:MAG: division/cell wall cluster transcriptional repressor MraZ [Deltaproteobacteria bacterium]|nr:division/cell wall cluster transcriptional repressor MraZ [Deltaproteobacteria bacterium]